MSTTESVLDLSACLLVILLFVSRGCARDPHDKLMRCLFRCTAPDTAGVLGSMLLITYIYSHPAK